MITRKKKFALVAAATAAVGATLTFGLAGSPASADPKQFETATFVGVGSDTTQDVLNTFAGHSAGINYPALQGGTSKTQLVSFDATGTPCITTRLGGTSFNRPNGSGAGLNALSRAIDPITANRAYGNASCGGLQDVSGLIDFARSSSSGTVNATGTITRIPFGRDGISYAAFRADGSPVTTLTKAELALIFGTGPQTIDGVRIIGCGIQTSSGTYGTSNTRLGITASNEDTGTTECNAFLGRAQENDGPDLAARGAAADAANNGTQVIIGFSAAAFIAKSNGVAFPNPGPGVAIGGIDDDGNGVNLGSPVTGTAPNLAANSAFYTPASFGRDVYNFVPQAKIDSAFGNDGLKAMFKGANSQVCLATSTITTFGFLPIATCGNTGTRINPGTGTL